MQRDLPQHGESELQAGQDGRKNRVRGNQMLDSAVRACFSSHRYMRGKNERVCATATVRVRARWHLGRLAEAAAEQQHAASAVCVSWPPPSLESNSVLKIK